MWRERAREGAVVRALDKGRRGGERVLRARARARAASGASTVPPPFLLFFSAAFLSLSPYYAPRC